MLDQPILKAMACFNHQAWPRSSELLDDHYVSDIALLFETYKAFFPESVTEEDVQEQWTLVKWEINDTEGLRSRKFHELWPDMILNYKDTYPDILRLVAISLLIPTDTSECERIFSLMNNLKTAQRSSLGKNLKNLMAWHTMGKDLDCAHVPVMDILTEFRALAGVRGRYAHRGQQPPQYDFRVKMEIED